MFLIALTYFCRPFHVYIERDFFFLKELSRWFSYLTPSKLFSEAPATTIFQCILVSDWFPHACLQAIRLGLMIKTFHWLP